MLHHSPSRLARGLFALIVCVMWPDTSYAQAQSGICHVDCLTAMKSCLTSTAGCQPAPGTCRDGRPCNDNRCSDGTRCQANWTSECAPCFTERANCMTKCPETWLPELSGLTLKAKVTPALERALLRELTAAERALKQGVQQASRHLEAYRSLLRAQARSNKISEETVSALDEGAVRTVATLQSKALPSCAATLISVGEIVFLPK